MMMQRRLLTLTRGIRLALFKKIGWGLLIGTTYVLQGLLMANIVTLILQGAMAWQAVGWRMLTVVSVIVLRTFFLWLNELSTKKTAAIVKIALRQRLFDKLLKLGPSYLQGERTGSVQSTLVDGVEGIEAYLTAYLPQIVVTIVSSIVLILVMAALSWPVALVILGGIVLALFGPRWWDRLLRKHGFNHWAAYGAFQAQLLDSLQGMNTLKAFNASRRRGAELKLESHALYKKTVKQLAVSLIESGIVGLATAAGAAIAVGIGVFQVAHGSMELGKLLIILFLSGECFRPIGDLNKYWHAGFLGISASPNILQLLDQETQATEKQGVGIPSLPKSLAIRIEHLSFSYENSSQVALEDVSFSIEAGETVAIVGKSGSGKSTLVQLLLRFMEASNGRIAINGIDARDYPLARLRSLIAVVWQETYLFYGTVANNLRLAKPEATYGEMEAAAQAANAHVFIMALPQGYETVIGERGTTLSGGEKQRLAIARALLKDAPFLILDEAASSVDSANEMAIQDGLERLMINRTTLVIAHRLSTVRHADRIIVMDEGRVVESGTHEELIHKQEAYAQMVRIQYLQEEVSGDEAGR